MRSITFLILLPMLAFSQEDTFTSALNDEYDSFRENTLNKRRIKHHELQPLLTEYRKHPLFTVKTVGKSIEGRDLDLVSIGRGKEQVFLWSQMHGDEPTATQAIFDIFNFLRQDDFKKEKDAILGQLTLHFLPMLNPDGAERYQRRNRLGIDINRDALRLQSPEGQTLKRVRDSLQANFGFNLHDQSTYYNAERTGKPATISYLAPAYNYDKEINEVRARAMKVIAYMNAVIQRYAPGQVGRYNDDFEPRAFGDNIQKWGTSTILIESGGYTGDIEKQQIRKLNFVSILSALYTIAQRTYVDIPLSAYWEIPENDRKLFDLKIKNATYTIADKPYVLDLGMNRLEVNRKDYNSFWYSSRIIDQGDLSTYYGYQEFDADGYTIVEGKIAPEIFETPSELTEAAVLEFLRKGYAYVRCKRIPSKMDASPFPIHLIGKTYEVPDLRLEVGNNPTFFLEKAGSPEFAVINGFLLDLKNNGNTAKMVFGNAMLFR